MRSSPAGGDADHPPDRPNFASFTNFDGRVYNIDNSRSSLRIAAGTCVRLHDGARAGRNGLRTVPVEQVRRGDLVLMYTRNLPSHRAVSHVGMARGPLRNGSIPTVEGNISNWVVLQERSITARQQPAGVARPLRRRRGTPPRDPPRGQPQRPALCMDDLLLRLLPGHQGAVTSVGAMEYTMASGPMFGL